MDYPVTLLQYNEEGSVEPASQVNSGSIESASQLQGSCHESCADSRSKASIDPFQDEDQLATARTVVKLIRLQTEMFDIFDGLVDNEDIAVDAYG